MNRASHVVVSVACMMQKGTLLLSLQVSEIGRHVIVRKHDICKPRPPTSGATYSCRKSDFTCASRNKLFMTLAGCDLRCAVYTCSIRDTSCWPKECPGAIELTAIWRAVVLVASSPAGWLQVKDEQTGRTRHRYYVLCPTYLAFFSSEEHAGISEDGFMAGNADAGGWLLS